MTVRSIYFWYYSHWNVTSCSLDVRLAFSRRTYNFFEPESFSEITNVTLIKEDNGVSEQTFTVRVVPLDYEFSSYYDGSGEFASGSGFSSPMVASQQFPTTVVFPPNLQAVPVEFHLLPDDQLEGLEYFALQIAIAEEGSPIYRRSAYSQSAMINIFDNECKFAFRDYWHCVMAVYFCWCVVVNVGFARDNYTVNEGSNDFEVCIGIFTSLPTSARNFVVPTVTENGGK